MDERRQKIAYLQANIFLRGSGGFGGQRKSSVEKPTVEVPKRQPDSTYVQKTSNDQAALYRVASTDHNPLHIDPSFAQMAGFKQPILHGLCSFGHSIRHVLLQYANGDVNKIRAVKGRFSRPVIPGQTLITEMWKEGDRVHFQTKVKETGEVAISGGYVQLHAAAGSGGSGSGSKQSDLESSLVFDELTKRLKGLPDIAKKTQAVYLWVITKNGKEVGKWTVDLKSGDGEIYEGEPKKDKAGCTLTIEDSNMMPLVTGKLNPQQAFMSGKLKIKGNIMLTQKLQNLLKDQSKL
jgi:3-hydroxyacyl-CoA dehydrogenase/3a,7a,12a-trihydroxy-5b-cholest-24-enoyl-CoA hydratase